ncbi:hypothetical protein BC826DRAFT_1028534 [Russula brevipes]|nr:hypothetical protein BC826DRAFT_1028534 [Russula brevipes]
MVLSTMPHGPPVNDNTSFANISESYYFSPDVSVNDTPAFVDYQAFYERDTYSGSSLCSGAFRECVGRRDGGSCVVSGIPIQSCDAVHIIPRCNSDAYIQFIVQSRRHLYTSESTEKDIFGINDVQNGILLNCLLHRQFGNGAIAFLKTPNRALNCDDVPSDPVYPEYPHRITMQHLVPDTGRYARPDDDARLPDGDSSPPALILDFMYDLLNHEPSSDNSSGPKNHGTRIS